MNEHRRDIEDNYEGYLDHELGYAWGVWDHTSLADMARHDEILHASESELDALDPAGLDDLQRLGLSRAHRRAGDLEGELDALRLVASDAMEHPGVDYFEAIDLAVDRLCTAQLFDEAEVLIERLEAQDWCEQPRVYTRALVRLSSEIGLGRQAFEEVLSEAPDDAETRYDIAEDLARVGRLDAATDMLDEAEETARRVGTTAVIVDIELLRAKLLENATTTE